MSSLISVKIRLIYRIDGSIYKYLWDAKFHTGSATAYILAAKGNKTNVKMTPAQDDDILLTYRDFTMIMPSGVEVPVRYNEKDDQYYIISDHEKDEA